MKNLLQRIEAVTGPSIWPIPAGFVAGGGLLAVVVLSQPELGTPAPSAPVTTAQASSEPAKPSTTLVLSGRVDPNGRQQTRQPAPVLLPPRDDARKETRRIQAGLPPLRKKIIEKVRARPAQRPAAGKPRRPRIAIVIDDMGFDRRNSARAVRLPPEVTLAYLPFAPGVRAQVRHARLKGHPVILHLPMEAPDHKGKPGYNVLAVNADVKRLRNQLSRMLGRFGGYTGVNNHMGSRFTRDRAKMDIVISELKKRGLYFLDSRTSGRSAGFKSAAAAGIPYAVRDVFLDHDPDKSMIRARMEETERIARAKGQAIAIGHPRNATMDLLAPWVAKLDARGFDLVRLDSLLTRPARKRLAQVAAGE